MKFVTRRFYEEDPATAVITCSDAVDWTGVDEFIKRLKIAVKQWTTHNPVGQEALKKNNNDFNFGDLILYAEDAGLVNLMNKQGIFQFKIELVSSDVENIDYDMNLSK